MLQRFVLVTGTCLLTFVAVMAPAQAAPPSATAPVVRVCPPVDPPDSALLIPLGDSATQFGECSNGQALRLPCPDGLIFDIDRSVCNFPDRVRQAPTQTTAGNARLDATGRKVTGLTATVTWRGKPLLDAPVHFTTVSGARLCDAFTDDSGHASCDAGNAAQGADQLLRGYTASYDGTKNLLPSNGKGTVTRS
ncbi:carbohydrate-binding module family 14 protein [Streptomyces sp. NPDC059247]|uniref:carbohydrate-binding module family 14 protein n=1 Tax=Streptomyces sp. NPDC059247 TaxID=3346790 RepID=UPI0036A4306D